MPTRAMHATFAPRWMRSAPVMSQCDAAGRGTKLVFTLGVLVSKTIKSGWRQPAAALFLFGLASGAWAQTATNDTLEEVIVTAERRVADVQKTAVSIAVISGDELLEKGITRIEAVLDQTPSAQITEGAQGAYIFIRGVGANGDTNFIDPAVAVSVDGVYSSRAELVRSSMYDVQRIEVLRGPQGTLYGRNAVGGSVNIIDNKPTLDGYGGDVNFQIGNYRLRHLDAAVNIPLGSTFAVRVAGMRETRDGYFSNGGSASDMTGGRIKLLWKPTDKLSIEGSWDYVKLGSLGGYTAPLAVPGAVLNPANGQPTTQVIGGTGNSRFAPDTYVVDWFCLGNIAGYTGVYPSSLGSCSGTKNGVTYTRHSTDDPWWANPDSVADAIDHRFLTSSIEINYDMDWSVLTVIPSYSSSYRNQITNLVNGTSILNAQGLAVLTPGNPLREKQYTGEVRLTSPESSKIKWVGGLFYLDNKNQPDLLSASQLTISSTSGYATYSGDRPTKSKAAFFQVTYPIVDRFRVTAGGRYTKDDKVIQYGVLTSASYVAPGGTAPLVPITYDSGLTLGASQSSNAFTYKAGVEFDAAPESMLYAQVSKGYEAGGFFTASLPAATFQPETLISYEIGSKNRFFSNTLQVNAAVYDYQYKNYQLQYSVPNASLPANYLCSIPVVKAALEARNGVGNACTTNNVSLVTGATPRPAGFVATQGVINADTGTNRGAELEVQWLATMSDQIGLSVAYIDAKYGRIASGIAAIDASSGTQTISTPKLAETLSYDHTFRLSSYGTLKVGGQTRHSDGYWTGIDHTRFGSWQDSYHRSDLRASYTLPNDKWTLAAWLQNLENDAQITGSFPSNRVFISTPRAYGLNLSGKF
jgi:iron complex outermembrane receptor protein